MASLLESRLVSRLPDALWGVLWEMRGLADCRGSCKHAPWAPSQEILVPHPLDDTQRAVGPPGGDGLNVRTSCGVLRLGGPQTEVSERYLTTFSLQATESIKMLVTLCQSDTEEIRNVASETLLSLGEFFFLPDCFLLALRKGSERRCSVCTV